MFISFHTVQTRSIQNQRRIWMWQIRYSCDLKKMPSLRVCGLMQFTHISFMLMPHFGLTSSSLGLRNDTKVRLEDLDVGEALLGFFSAHGWHHHDIITILPAVRSGCVEGYIRGLEFFFLLTHITTNHNPSTNSKQHQPIG